MAKGIPYRHNSEKCISLCATCRHKPTGNFPRDNFGISNDTTKFANNVCAKGFGIGVVTDDAGDDQLDVAECDHYQNSFVPNWMWSKIGAVVLLVATVIALAFAFEGSTTDNRDLRQQNILLQQRNERLTLISGDTVLVRMSINDYKVIREMLKDTMYRQWATTIHYNLRIKQLHEEQAGQSDGDQN